MVHGVRHAADLGYSQELKNWESSSDGRFKLLQTLTREEKQGLLHGRIPQLLENGTLERETGWEINRSNSAVLLCGNPAMLDEMEDKLGQRDMKKHRTKSPGQIVLERYW